MTLWGANGVRVSNSTHPANAPDTHVA